MISGGYNIIDFMGKEFISTQLVEVSDEIISKFTDFSKPVLFGNFTVIFSEGDTELKIYIPPSFAPISYVEDSGLMVIKCSGVDVNIGVASKIITFS